MPAKIGVVIPFYNDHENLAECLRALDPGNSGLDVVVVDDGSLSPIQGGAGARARVHRLPENAGQAAARNAGALLVSGDYLLFLDSDVLAGPVTMREVNQFVERSHPEGMVGMQGIFSLDCPARNWASLIYNTVQRLTSAPAFLSTSVNTSFLLIQRKAFEAIGGFDPGIRYLEDVDFSRRMARLGFYLQNGPAEFQHRKKCSWRWLVQCWILGGAVRRSLPEITGDPVRPLPSGVKRNTVLRDWMISGLLFLLALPAASLSGTLPLGLLLASAWRSRKILRAYVSVNPNPVFVAVGVSTSLAAPWIIALGMILGKFGQRSAWWAESRENK